MAQSTGGRNRKRALENSSLLGFQVKDIATCQKFLKVLANMIKDDRISVNKALGISSILRDLMRSFVWQNQIGELAKALKDQGVIENLRKSMNKAAK